MMRLCATVVRKGDMWYTSIRNEIEVEDIENIIGMVTCNGADRLGLGHVKGRIEEGMDADIILLG